MVLVLLLLALSILENILLTQGDILKKIDKTHGTHYQHMYAHRNASCPSSDQGQNVN